MVELKKIQQAENDHVCLAIIPQLLLNLTL